MGFPTETPPGGGGGGGEGGVTVHSALTGRSAGGQHPTSAITGLDDALTALGLLLLEKADTDDLQEDPGELVNIADDAGVSSIRTQLEADLAALTA